MSTSSSRPLGRGLITAVVLALALLIGLVCASTATAAQADAPSTTGAQPTASRSAGTGQTTSSPAPRSSSPRPTTRATKSTAPTATRPAPKVCVDEVGVLASGTCATISKVLDQDEKLTSDEIAVLVVDTTGDETIEHYATRTFNSWGIGKAGKDNGVLLLVAVDDRALRIEVGTGLEKVLTDGEAAEIIYGTITPEFKQGEYQAGILAGLDAIRRQLKHSVTSSNSLVVAGDGEQPRVTRTRTQYIAGDPDDNSYADGTDSSSDNSMVLWFVLLVVLMLVSWAVSAYRKANGYDDGDGDGSGSGSRGSSYRSRGFSSFGGSSRSRGSSPRSSGGSSFGGGRSRGGGSSGSW